MTGRIHSFQSLGTVDGPGIRFVAFLQGCNLRCGCCHNPDTWDCSQGKEYTSEQVFERVLKYKSYFGNDGGITLSGGEPLLQAEFAKEIFSLCKSDGINTCLDTSGSILNDEVQKLIAVTDRVLLDIKYSDEEKYKKYAGCTLGNVLEFLDFLEQHSVPVTLRQVIIPGLNDDCENILKLCSIANSHSCVDKVELLPFRKICKVKYDNMNIKFPFEDIPEPATEKMRELNGILNQNLK